MKKLIILFVTVFSFKSNAILFDFNLNSFQDTLSTSSDSKSSRLFGSVGILADLSKSDNARFNFGFSVLSVSSKSEVGTSSSETFSSMDMGPTLRWTIDSKKLFSLTLVYAFLSKGKYETTLQSQTITGTSTYLKFAVEPQITENLNLGIAVNYYAAQYANSVSNSTETAVSYKSNWIFPSFSLVLHY